FFFFRIAQKIKKRTGDQILPKESSICVKKGHKFNVCTILHDRAIVLELVQRRVAKIGLVIKGGKSSGGQGSWLHFLVNINR
ncbi:unnamed protein product, partial [Staurois parvus]